MIMINLLTDKFNRLIKFLIMNLQFKTPSMIFINQVKAISKSKINKMNLF